MGTRLEFTYGDRLQKAREVAGYTQDEMAELMGVSPQTIRTWESDRNRPRAARAITREWARITGVDAGDILHELRQDDTNGGFDSTSPIIPGMTNGRERYYADPSDGDDESEDEPIAA
jgi:transcriptional regulator with XRE-family HTH domain